MTAVPKHTRLLILSFLLFLFPSLLPAQEIQKHAEKIEAFIPQDWSLKESVVGDLNDDQHPDLAFIIQKDSLTRALCIAFFHPKKQRYDIKIATTLFLYHIEKEGQEDPVQDCLSISDGKLHIRFHFDSTPKATTSGNSSYTFKYQNKKFRFIEYDSDFHHNKSGHGAKEHLDLLNGTRTTTTYNLSIPQSESTLTRKFTLQENYTLDMMDLDNIYEIDGLLL